MNRKVTFKELDLVKLAEKISAGRPEDAQLMVLNLVHDLQDKWANIKQQVDSFELEVEKALENVRMQQGPSGERGEVGPAGESVVGPIGPMGPRGLKGEKGDSIVGPAGRDGRNGVDGKNGIDGKDGAMGIIDEATIGYLEEEIKKVEKKIPVPRVGWGAHPLRILDSSGNAVDKVARHLKFTGATTTRSPDGVVTVAIAASLSILAATGTIDDSNTVFTFASAPTLININGAFYRKTGGAISWTGTTNVTLSSPIGTGGSIFGLG